MGHLLNAEIIEKATNKLAIFIRKVDSAAASEEKYQILRKTDEGEFLLPKASGQTFQHVENKEYTKISNWGYIILSIIFFF